MQINKKKAAMCGVNFARSVLFMLKCLFCKKQFLGKITQKYINNSQMLSENRLNNVVFSHLFN